MYRSLFFLTNMLGGRLEGTVSVITGGAGGIGSAAGLIFCREGSKVALIDRDDGSLQAAMERIRKVVSDAPVIAVSADLGDEIAAQQAVDKVLQQWGAIDILVNNLGMRAYESIAEASWDKWDAIVRVNFLSYVSMTRAALPSLRASDHGSIINTSSINAFYGRKGTVAYDSMKAAVLAFTRSLAFEESEHGIRANSVCPGYTRTPFHEQRLGLEEINAFKPPNIMQRWASPEEIAYPMLWLASKEASYVTASTLVVDGGFPVQPAAT